MSQENQLRPAAQPPVFTGYLAHIPFALSGAKEYTIQPISIPIPPPHSETSHSFRCNVCKKLVFILFAGTEKSRWYHQFLWSRSRLYIIHMCLKGFLILTFFALGIWWASGPNWWDIFLFSGPVLVIFPVVMYLVQQIRNQGSCPRIQDGSEITGGEVVWRFFSLIWRIPHDKEHRLVLADGKQLAYTERLREANSFKRKAQATVLETPVQEQRSVLDNLTRYRWPDS